MDNGNNALNITSPIDTDQAREALKRDASSSFAANDPIFNEPKDDFRSKTSSVGLDTGKFSEQERNIIALELARMGANIGFELTGYLVENRAGRLAENVAGDVERALKKRDLWDRFLALMAYYDAMYYNALEILDAMFDYVDERIAEIDAEIEEYKNDTIEHSFNSSSEADEHIRQLEAEKEDLERIKTEELEAHKEQIESEKALPDFEHLEEISDQLMQTATNHAANNSGKSAPSKSRMDALMARYKSTKGDSHGEEETEKPQLPQL